MMLSCTLTFKNVRVALNLSKLSAYVCLILLSERVLAALQFFCYNLLVINPTWVVKILMSL